MMLGRALSVDTRASLETLAGKSCPQATKHVPAQPYEASIYPGLDVQWRSPRFLSSLVDAWRPAVLAR